jgi:hypothetical protein
MLQGLISSLMLITATSAAAQATRSDGVIEQRIDGPATVCGQAFAIEIGAGEHAIKRDPQIDFLTYYVEGSYGSFVLYEGNAPMPHDDEIRTGLNWPQVVAIHDNRSSTDAGPIRDRIIVGARRAVLCPSRASDSQ